MQKYLSEDPQFPALTLIGALFIGAFFGYLNDTLLNVALPTFMGAFHLSESQAQWLTSGFLLVMGAFTPITANLIQWFTTRQAAFITFGNFALGTLICLTAQNFPMLLLGRVIQAISAAISVPLLMTTIYAIYPPERRGTLMGLVAMVFSLAPTLGPTLSGLLLQYGHWRLLFALPLLFIIAVLFVIHRKVRHNVMRVTRPPIDLPSALLSVLGFGALVYGASQFRNLSGGELLGIFTAALLFIALFVWRQLRLITPLLNLRALENRQFRSAVIILALAFFMFLGLELLLPIYGQQVRQFTPLLTGLLLMPASLAEGLLAPLLGRLLDRRGGKIVLRLGAYLLLLGAVLLFHFVDMVSNPWLMALCFTIFAGGVACCITGETHGLNALDRSLTPHGTAIISTINPIAGALGASFFVGLMSWGESLSGQETAALRQLAGVHLALAITIGLSAVAFYFSWKIRNLPAGQRAH